MKKITTVLRRSALAGVAVLSATLGVSAQQAILAAGGEATGAGGTVSFSVGQIDYIEATGGGGKANQGVQQPELPDFMWTGETSTDWAVTTNWSKRVVPTNASNVLITRYPANQPHITLDPATPAETNDLAVRSGATVTVDAGKAMTINGDLNNAGTMVVKASNSAIGSLITEGNIAGNGDFKMEQYLNGTGAPAAPNGVFHSISSPLVGATSAVHDAVAVSNKLWIANETTQNYTEVDDNSTVLNTGQGYVVRMGGTGVVTFDGSAYYTGDFSINGLTRTGNTAPGRGYNLLGNPYPSTLDWEDANITNLLPSIWFRTHDNSDLMLYDVYNASSNIGTTNSQPTPITGLIPPTQAFWVRVAADGQTGSLSWDNTDRTHGVWSDIYKQQAEEGTVRLKLGNGTVADEGIVHFTTEAQDSFDDFDSHKMWVPNIPQLYTTVGADSLVINGLFSTETNPVVDLGVKLPTVGNYSFNATSITLLEQVWLEDRLLNNFQLLNQTPVYDFTSTIAGNIPTRFALHFGALETGVPDRASFTQVYSFENTVTVNVSRDIANGMVSILDMAGRLVQTATLNGARTVIPTELSTGVYLVRLESDKGAETHRVYIK